MAGYGYRLYTVKLVAGWQKSKAMPFDQCGSEGDEHVGLWIRRTLDRLESVGPLTGQPLLIVGADETYRDLPDLSSHVRVAKQREYRTHFRSHSGPTTRTLIKLRYARNGRVDYGVKNTEAVDLRDTPTGNGYRALLYLPRTGTRGLMALEAVPSAPTPGQVINQWIARASIDLAFEDLDALSEGSTAEPRPWKLNFNQYPNIDRIHDAVTNNPAAKVVLRKEAIAGGGTRGSEEVIISGSLTERKRRESAALLAVRMVRQLARNKRLGRGAELSAMTDDEDDDAVGVDDLERLIDGPVSGVDWTDGHIAIEDETGLKKIGLETIDKFFVYPLHSMTPLSDRQFIQQVGAGVSGLQTKLGLDLDLA